MRSTHRPPAVKTRLIINWPEVLAYVVIVVSIIVLGMWALAIADEARASEPTTVSHGGTLPPCQTEDSDNCYWDAATQGNGVGRSFVTVDGVTTYTGGGYVPSTTATCPIGQTTDNAGGCVDIPQPPADQPPAPTPLAETGGAPTWVLLPLGVGLAAAGLLIRRRARG